MFDFERGKQTFEETSKISNFNKELAENGFTTFPFPNQIRQTLVDHITQEVQRLCNSKPQVLNHSELSAFSKKVPDDIWSKKMNRAFRMFPPNLTDLVLEWADVEIKSIVNRHRVTTNVVKIFEAELNTDILLNTPAFYWRCVRSGKPDAGRAHRDATFWEIELDEGYDPLISFKWDFRKDCLKVWIPLAGCETNNTLQVIPHSHAEQLPTEVGQTEYGTRPTIASQWLEQNSNRFISPRELAEEGHCIIFDMDTVHRGPTHDNATLRISAELNLIFE